MNKEDWKKQLKELERLLGVAQGNVKLAQNQADELEFNIENYKRKIKEL